MKQNEIMKLLGLFSIIGVLVLILLLVQQNNFSYSDYLVNKVIQKLEADYEPYGPNMAPQQPNTIQPPPTPPQTEDVPW